MPSANKQGRYWFGTLSWKEAYDNDYSISDLFDSHDDVVWVYGQQELPKNADGTDGYRHYQFVFSLAKHYRFERVKKLFPDGVNPHLELTKCKKKSEDYVSKTETRIDGSGFEYGTRYIDNIWYY